MALKVYSFCCEAGHFFEGWLRTDADWKQEVEAGRLACPVCGSMHLEKRPDAPNFSAVKGTVRTDTAKDIEARRKREETAEAEAMQAAAIRAIREMAGKAEDVGRRFPDEVRAIHKGDAAPRLLKGECSPDDAQALLEEGCPVMPIPDFAKTDD